MKNEEVQKILEHTNQVYEEVAGKYSQVRKAPWPEMDFLFGRYLRKNDLVLDIGCGNGRFYESFVANEVDYTGIDNSKNLIEIAQRNYPEGKFSLASALNLPFSDETFDAVYSIAVLHHMPSTELRERFVMEAKRVLKKSGYLVLTVWDLSEKKEDKPFNVFSLFQKRIDNGDMFIPWYGAKDCYFHSFSREEFRLLVDGCGLGIIDQGEVEIGKKPYNNLYIVSKK